jgi:hypothetical protein
MSKACSLALLILLSTGLAKPSTVILQFRDGSDLQRRVILAADSLGSFNNSEGVSRQVECKISVHEHVVFAFAGPVRDYSAGYDAYRNMESCLELSGSFGDKMQAFQERMLADLNTFVNVKTSVEVVAVDASHFPRHYLGVFTPSSNGRWQVQPESGVRERLGYQVRYLVIGIRDHVGKELTTTPRQFEDNVTGLEHLIKLEERAHPELVGGVVTMVEIHAGVIKWLSVGTCGLPSNPMPRLLVDIP